MAALPEMELCDYQIYQSIKGIFVTDFFTDLAPYVLQITLCFIKGNGNLVKSMVKHI